MKYIVTVNGKKYEVEVEKAGAAAAPAQEPVQAKAAVPAPAVKKQPAADAVAASGKNTIQAPMPGTILSIKVEAGQSVKRGDVMFILEAMKMENEIVAPQDSVVANIAVSKGSSVNTGDVLAVLQ